MQIESAWSYDGGIGLTEQSENVLMIVRYTELRAPRYNGAV